MTDPLKPHRVRPLAEHLCDYAESLRAKGDTEEHVKETAARVQAILDGCGFTRLDEVDAAKASAWLNGLRRDGPKIRLPESRTHFTPAEVAALLDISGAAVRAAVKRHGLDATGKGKARRLPRATVEVLCDRTRRGNGPQTANHYVRSVRGFFRWLVRAKRAAANPVESLSLLNTQTDVRRGRRELTADELRALLEATRNSEWTFRGLAGIDRFFLYLTAATTGFRARALANLTPSDFDLDADAPVVTLAARFNKSRKPKVQPLPAETAAELRGFLAGKPANMPVWFGTGTWARDKRGAEMIRGDLEAVGIPYAVEGPDGPEYADFHALRHTFLTLGGRSGIDLRTLQELAGHSKPELTARYSHRRLHDLAGAVGKLPTLLAEGAKKSTDPVPPALRATGTDGWPGARWRRVRSRLATVRRPVVSTAPTRRVAIRWYVGLVKCTARTCASGWASGGRIMAAVRGRGPWGRQQPSW